MTETPVFVLAGLPLPPSENEIYRNIPGRGRCATRALSDYQRAMKAWASCCRGLWEIRNTVSGWWAVSVEAELYFHFRRLFTVDRRIKRLDTSNRQKALHDCLGSVLQLDDRVFWSVSATKHPILDGSEEGAIVRLKEIKRPNYLEIA